MTVHFKAGHGFTFTMVKGMIKARRSRDMLILIEWHKNISVQTVACIVKHVDPQINSVTRGVQ